MNGKSNEQLAGPMAEADDVQEGAKETVKSKLTDSSNDHVAGEGEAATVLGRGSTGGPTRRR